jgi:hypothetical protein
VPFVNTEIFYAERARTARDHVNLTLGRGIAANGRLPKTLPEPIKRARDKDLCGFAGEGNVVERSERYASVEKPEEPKDSKRRAWAGLLGAGLFRAFSNNRLSHGWRRRL